jgi:hypothetical protein
MNNYSIINGKKYKNCKEGQIRNPITNRCINSNKYKQKNAKKIQNFIKPIINRVSANIEDRIRYYLLIKKFLNININKNRKCLKLYKIINNLPIFRLGNNIILKERIGSNSAHGMVYLTTFRDKKIYKYACKITIATNKALLENEIQEQLTRAIIKCPHFPILYGTYHCNYMLDFNDSFQKSINDEKTIEQDIKLYPKVIQKAMMENKQLLITFNELANGDLNQFLLDPLSFNSSEVFNALVQVFLSLMFYYQEIRMLHCDAHGGNFLYHKIKKGGYFHYNIYGKDYYLKNLGYLWIIWDFEQSIDYNYQQYLINYDFSYILNAFLPTKKKDFFDKTGWNYNINYYNNKLIYNKIQKIVKDYNMIKINKDKTQFPKLINSILNLFIKYKIISDKLPKNAIINNKTPYTISNIK